MIDLGLYQFIEQLKVVDLCLLTFIVGLVIGGKE